MATTARQVAIKGPLGRLRSGFFDVRMTKHQRLGCQRFDKPTGMKLRFARAEEVQQYIEGQKVEDGTDRSDEQHEIADQTNIPVLGLFEVSIVNIVRWN